MSAWLPFAPCTPEGCARGHGPAAGPVKALARLLAGLATVGCGLLLAPLAALFGVLLGAPFRHRLTRCWSRAVLRAFGVRVHVVGVPHDLRASLVVANHISWLDIPLVAAVLPGRMLAKSEVRSWPVLGPLAARGGTFFLERDRLRALPAAVASMADALRGGARVVVFPEGSTWCGRGQGRFRPAAFQAALDAGAAVQPVHIAYTPTGAAAFVGDDPLLASLWRVAAAERLTAEIRLLPPILPGSRPDRRSLARAAQLAVASDSANLPSPSVHQCVRSIPAAASSVRTPS
ncbi:lysophospholipid acyltransferase family protein [Streptomyces pristinaespiralis]|uniref:1-acylglycerol-3-phosphate O-acyltransferase n=2 Tax=Streptomyces pristinaespiralis TaxID=38300 RepID=B5H893_STRE2|nr:lysophospholipid acyltransferase family protein [Streptomyces pristinaespiralis]ALC19038.1 acyltransferase [Streptomyces pristinaespiralis]EDY63084.1 1-acylglycerol-3-phosphate O-acyltransferase [Streptomyces pristinaespiralis ATCC 25486]QMU17862.1 1-acyl-sn-glycerol-3-phosphate acyltransferase [Streptomyces pristinaespiralis]